MRRLFFLSLFFCVGIFFIAFLFTENTSAQTCDLCQISGGECPPELYDSVGTCDTGMGFNGTCCVLKSGSGGNSGDTCQEGLCTLGACTPEFSYPARTCQMPSAMRGTCCTKPPTSGGVGGDCSGGECAAGGNCSAGFPVVTGYCTLANGGTGTCCMPADTIGPGGPTGPGEPGVPVGGVPTGPECPGYWQAGICFPGGTGLSNVPVYEILYKLVWWLLAIVGFIGIIAFTISGMQYLLSAGSEEMVKTAKNSMKYSIIGMVVALSGLVIIFFIHDMLAGELVLFIDIGF